MTPDRLVTRGRGELPVTHLVQDVPVQVRHVALAGHGPVVVVPEVLLQRHGVVRDAQHRAQVVGQHLQTSTSLMLSRPFARRLADLLTWINGSDKHSH